MRPLFPALALCLSAAVFAQQPEPPLLPAELQRAEGQLRAALAGPREKAFAQILTEVRILRDELADSAAVYDLVVRYDPRRYRTPYMGLYPLDFEAQFILWGQRIALYSRSTRWLSGRFYLHDISTPRHAWIPVADARRLYPEKPLSYPPPLDPGAEQGYRAWLKLIAGAGGRTDLRHLSLWLRLMHHESRPALIRRLRAGRQKSAGAAEGS